MKTPSDGDPVAFRVVVPAPAAVKIPRLGAPEPVTDPAIAPLGASICTHETRAVRLFPLPPPPETTAVKRMRRSVYDDTVPLGRMNEASVQTSEMAEWVAV